MSFDTHSVVESAPLKASQLMLERLRLDAPAVALQYPQVSLPIIKTEPTAPRARLIRISLAPLRAMFWLGCLVLLGMSWPDFDADENP